MIVNTSVYIPLEVLTWEPQSIIAIRELELENPKAIPTFYDLTFLGIYDRIGTQRNTSKPNAQHLIIMDAAFCSSLVCIGFSV
jgi:hypothetical protein